MHDEFSIVVEAASINAVRTFGEVILRSGRDIVILDMREQTGFFDYFVIVSGSSRRQLHSMSENIDDVLTKREGAKRIGLEGVGDSRWILLDYGDVVVHLFDPELRAYYALEDLWAAARRVDFSPSSSPQMP